MASFIRFSVSFFVISTIGICWLTSLIFASVSSPVMPGMVSSINTTSTRIFFYIIDRIKSIRQRMYFVAFAFKKSFCDCRLSISSSTQRIFANAILVCLCLWSWFIIIMYPTFVLLFSFSLRRTLILAVILFTGLKREEFKFSLITSAIVVLRPCL